MTIGRLFTNNRIDFTCRANFPSFNTSIKKKIGVRQPLFAPPIYRLVLRSLASNRNEKERERNSVLFYQTDGKQRENSFTFFPLRRCRRQGRALRNRACHVINVLFPPPPTLLLLPSLSTNAKV